MRVVILGGGGMLGRKLAARLAEGALGLAEVVQVDISLPQGPEKTQKIAMDLTAPGAMAQIAGLRPDLVYHLAAAVSGQAEAEFDLGYAVNFDLSRALAEALRSLETRPRIIFSSSLAVYGPPFPEPVPETLRPAPASSYGAQKAMVELLLADYARKGLLDAVSLRLPTVSIRPGRPNAAASGFLSGILREPLNGVEAVLPVAETVRAWIASPGVTVEGLLRAARLPSPWTDPNPLNLRGITVSVSEMLSALERAAGPAARALVRARPDPAIARIVESWPAAFETRRAEALGFPVNESIDAIIAEYRQADMNDT